MTHEKARASVVTVCGVAVFAGLALILQDRITKLTMEGVGSITAVTERAIADAKTIGELKDRVENQSATVDLVAKQASLAKALSEQVEEQNKRAAQKLDVLDKSINDANAALSHIKSETDFTQTVVAAQNDDRKAFDRLEHLAEEKNNPFSSSAEQAWITILKNHASGVYQSGFAVPWKQGLDPSELLLPDLVQVYSEAPGYLKPALLEYIWKRADISKLDRLDFMIRVLKSDPSLTAVEYAGRYFNEGTDLKITPLAVQSLAQWWMNIGKSSPASDRSSDVARNTL